MENNQSSEGYECWTKYKNDSTGITFVRDKGKLEYKLSVPAGTSDMFIMKEHVQGQSYSYSYGEKALLGDDALVK